jgi:hypothetical protein
MWSTELNPNYIAFPVAVAVLLLAAWAERIHARRSWAVRWLAFGPAGEPRRWTYTVPVLRVLAATSLAWGLTLLSVLPAESLDTTGNDSKS